MKVNFLASFLLVCFVLSTTGANKKRLLQRNKQTKQSNAKIEQTTASYNEEQDEFYDGKSNIQDLLFAMYEADESGGGTTSNGIENESGKSVKMTYEEMELERTVIEANITRVLGSKSPSETQLRLECNKTYLEYKIFDLINSKRLPQEAVFSSWNEKPTLREKVSFLNQTLIRYGIEPFLGCELENLDLNLSPQQYEMFKLTQAIPTTKKDHGKNEELIKTTPRSNASDEAHSTPASRPSNESPGPDEEVLRKKKKLVEIINAGFLPRDTLIKLSRNEIDAEWIQKNISKNREYIMSTLPNPIRNLILEGKMPEDIEEKLFSGNYNKTEMAKLLFYDDKVVKMLLPSELLDMLQDRPVPQELKVILASGKNKTEMKNAIINDTELLKEMMSPSMYYFYSLFKIQRNKDINTALSVVLMVILTCVMMSLGCTMTLNQIGEHAKKPKGVIIALFAQFIIMPAAAFGLTKAFDLEVFAAMAVLICGCCPGGNLSNMLAYALSGDMNLSILMTTCSSIIGLGLMPLNIFIYSRFIVAVDGGQVVPFDKIVLNIAFTIIPVGIGIAIRHYKPTWVRNVMRIGGIVLGIGTILIAVLSGVMFGDAFFVYFPTKVLACCAILPLTGYVFGYVFAWIAREPPKCRRTICVETGCQNVQLCSTVLKLAFNPIVVGVLFLMPLVYMCFQVVEAVLIIFLFRLRNRCSGKKELVDEDSEVKKKSSDVESSTDDKKNSENDTKGLLDGQNENNGDLQGNTTTQNDKEAWPMDGKPTDAIVDSFKSAGSEHLF